MTLEEKIEEILVPNPWDKKQLKIARKQHGRIQLDNRIDQLKSLIRKELIRCLGEDLTLTDRGGDNLDMPKKQQGEHIAFTDGYNQRSKEALEKAKEL